MTLLWLALFLYAWSVDPVEVDRPRPPVKGEWVSVWVRSESANEVTYERWLVPRGTVFYQPEAMEVIYPTVDLRGHRVWDGERILRETPRNRGFKSTKEAPRSW